MSVLNLLSGLDNEQGKAVALETNGIATAGAGSGKTRVLASRYAWLITERNFAPEEILTLTFTNKAVNEMYSRIHKYLLEQTGAGNEIAARALTNFHKARISTLDAFSANIARTAAARYGISPEFTSNNAGLKDLAADAALRFVLDHREAPAIRELLVDHKIKNIAEDIFSLVVLTHSPISSPPDFDKILALQKEEILRAWREKTLRLESLVSQIIDAMHNLAGLKIKSRIKLEDSLRNILLMEPPPSAPDIEPLLETGVDVKTGWDENPLAAKARQQIKEYFEYYSRIIAASIPGNFKEEYTQLVDCFRQIKGKEESGLCFELEAIANYACNFGLCAGIFGLLKKFQAEFNAKKRETGFLSFNDIARLAVDALADHPDIRKVYKDTFRMIMIDEFQDNNALQRDLIYLLAENSGRDKKGIATPGELEKNRMFFVGDEKQSIYRFRGADVAVFRSLGRDFHGIGETIELSRNYRSRPGLIEAFNHIFSRVFLPAGPDLPDYEAVYSGIKPPDNTGGENLAGISRADSSPLAHFCFLNKDELPDDKKEGIKSQDLEAVFIAKKIRDMVESGEKIPKRTDKGTELRPCKWSDFTVLERSYTHQSSLEKYFREFGIPYDTDRPAGLFSDAPILDLRAYLRLIVYPEDRIAYAALIRSPFMRLSDQSLAVCMLSGNTEPFAEENEAMIPEDDRELYRRARERYNSLREASRFLSITELITKLWYEEGYRYETLWTEEAQVYENLFDLFFSLASEAEAGGRNLAAFIEYLEDVMKREEKPDDKEIPGEGEAGVRIMSIHKCKGLEFPVVFVFDCANSGNSGSNSGMFCFHNKYGLILNIPQVEELPNGGNYFRDILDEEENLKNIAELRRLLYVVMTRAECRLFLTFTLPAQTGKEKKEWDAEGLEFNEDTIRRRLLQLEEKDIKRKTFLTLLAPVLPDCPPSLCSLETIPALSRAEISHLAKPGDPSKSGSSVKHGETASNKSQREAALAAAPVYENAEVIPEGKAGPLSLQASKLKPQGSFSAEPSALPREEVEELSGISPADFGSLVHAVLEARLAGQTGNVPSKIKSRIDEENFPKEIMTLAEKMADGFIVSELGKRWAASGRRESEYSIITSAAVEGKKVAVMGQIDLLFEEAPGGTGGVVVVDFKTDRIENPEVHYGQLAAYYQAARDIFGKPVSVWLFYLRSGRAVDATAAVERLSLNEIAAAGFRNIADRSSGA